MAQYNKVRGISFLLLIILVLFINGCKEPVEFQSKWLDKKIIIDADDADWANYPFFYDEKTQSHMGIYNDSENLYIHFQTMDRKIQKQIERMGLTIWFNEQGGKEKDLGLCFPAGGGPGGFGMPFGRGSNMPGLPPGMPEEISAPPHEGMEAGEKMSPSKMAPRGPIMDTMLKIMSGEKDKGYSCNLEKAARIGIEVKSKIDDKNRFIYELKMPFVEKDNTAFFITPSALNQIGMGIMSARMKRGGPPKGMDGGGMDRGGRGGDMPGGGDMGGRGPMGGGMGGGGMGGGPGPDRDMEKSGNAFEIWFNVTLAPKPVGKNIQAEGN
jgi:hypothetical protein